MAYEKGIERGNNLVVPVSYEELCLAHRLAAAGDEAIAHMVRRWIKAEYRRQFGEEPAPEVELKGAKTRARKKREQRQAEKARAAKH